MALYTIDNRSAPIDFEIGDDARKRTIQNAKNLIMCKMGEIPFDRMRGLNPALFDLSIDEINEVILPEVERALGWEPDAKAVSAYATLTEEKETLIVVTINVDV